MTKLYTCFLFLFFSINANSQNSTASITGSVLNKISQPAIGVTVRLIHLPDSAITRSGSSNVKGVFVFDNIKPGNYLMMISGIGYKKMRTKAYQVSAAENLVIEPIKLNDEAFALSEVVIRDKKNYVEVKSDKTVLNVDRNILAPGTSVLNLLGNAPGVKVNSLGEVVMRADQLSAIYVNGKQIKLQGADLAAFLQNLPSADVSQIELIPNPPAKYDAAGAGGIINIILKKGVNVGFNGSATASAGYGRFGKAAITTSGNYRTKKFNIFGGAGFDYNKTYQITNTYRNINDAEHAALNTDYYNTRSTPTFTYRLGTDIFLDSLHTLGFLVYGNTSTANFVKSTATQLYKSTLPDSSFITNSNRSRPVNTTNYNINYQGVIGKRQTLNVDADMFVYHRSASEQLITTSSGIRQAFNILKPVYDTLNSVAPTSITDQSLKIDYSNKLSKANRFDAGIKGSYINSTNSQSFNMLQNGVAIPNAGLTSDFVYKEKIGAAYVNFAHNQTKLTYSLGLRLEDLRSDANLISESNQVDRNYLNLFPSAQITYKPNGAQYILDYNRRATYLDYSIVNPIVAYQDNYYNSAGNPYLQPAITNFLQLSYFKPGVLRVNLYGQQVSNFFNFIYFSQNDATKVLTITRINLRDYKSAGVSAELPVKVSSLYYFDLDADISYQRFQDYQGFLNKGTQDLIFKLNQNFNITPTLVATIYAQYESNTFYGVSSFKPNYYISGGISKQFSKLATLTLNASDIFNTDRDRYYTNFANLDVTGYQKRETQVVRLSFTYRFGKRSVKNARRHTTGNTDEQSRINATTL